MKRLFFEINGKIWQYKVLEYKIDSDDFYCFIDIVDGQFRRLHKSLFKGEEEC